MKAVTINPLNEIKMIDVERNGTPLYDIMRKAVGGYYENVKPKRLPEPYVMIVNEEGLLIDLPKNAIASYLHETDKHGFPIVGDVIFLKLGFFDGEPDAIALSDEEADELMKLFENLKGEINND